MGSPEANKRNLTKTKQHKWFISQHMVESTLSVHGSFSHFLYCAPFKVYVHECCVQPKLVYTFYKHYSSPVLKVFLIRI